MITKGDFISVDYTGKTVEGIVFDTTEESVAKKNHLHSQKAKYAPAIICVGEHHLVRGLDGFLEGKEIGKTYDVTLQPEAAFGKKDAKLIQLVSMGKFTKANIDPQVGMQVNVDNNFGIVRKAGGGRVLVDFNHPLSGIPVVYTVTVKEKITDPQKQIQALLDLQIPGMEAQVHEGKATITYTVELPEVLQGAFKTLITKLVHGVKDVHFVVKEAPKQAKA